MTDDSVDVVVAGGGPAGLSAAAELARSGISVVVFEREPEIGSPVHTSGATAQATVSRYGIPRTLYHPVTRLRFLGPTAEAAFDYDEPVLVVLDVRGTYQRLAEEVPIWGGTVQTSATVRDTLSRNGTVAAVTVESESGKHSVDCKIVVDATGYRAAVSKAAGLHGGFDRFGVGAEVELIAPRVRQDEALMLVGSKYAPAGYGWVFPWGQQRVRIGVGVHHGDVRSNPRKHLETLLRDAGELGIDLRGAQQTEDHFGLIPAHRLPERLTAPGVLAVGDAACQATLVVGEGIRVSLDAGVLAGRYIAQAIEEGTYATGGLAAYDTAFRKIHGRSLSLGYEINRRLATFDDNEWDEKLGLLQDVPAKILPDLLQANFSPAMLPALLASPRLWGTLARYAGRGARKRLSGRGTT